ncbi:MAG: hypothetical protein WAV74_00950 [Anaerolineae bacterium]
MTNAPAPGGLPRLPAAKSLFSQHYLQTRLPEHAEWTADPRPVFDTVAGLWERAHTLGASWNEAQTVPFLFQTIRDNRSLSRPGPWGIISLTQFVGEKHLRLIEGDDCATTP